MAKETFNKMALFTRILELHLRQKLVERVFVRR